MVVCLIYNWNISGEMISEVKRWRLVFHILMEPGSISVVRVTSVTGFFSERNRILPPSSVWAFMQETSSTSAGNGLAL